MNIFRLPRRVFVLLAFALLAATVAAFPLSAQTPRTCQGEVATIVGTTGPDEIVGTQGDDVVVALGGADVIIGRGGDDLICAGWGPDTIRAGSGVDRVFAGPGRDMVFGGPEDDVLFGGPGRDTITGNTGNDTVNGGPGGDSLMGGLGNDQVNGGLGPDRLVGGDGSDSLDGGAGRDICAFDDPHERCDAATKATQPKDEDPVKPDPPVTPIEVDRVIHISIDGLRSDHVTEELTPVLSAMRASGASTLNARNDPSNTQTLPNHTGQFTGRPVVGDGGHGVDFNEDDGSTVHKEAGEYVRSVFDVAHDHGLVTAMYVGKSKFDLHNRTWGENGRADSTGEDDGRDKIDVFVRDDPDDALQTLVTDLNRTDLGRQDAYIFFHIRLPDSAGHDSDWGSSDYRDAVSESDDIVGKILDAIGQNPSWSDSTGFIVTTDHGGPLGEDSHHKISKPGNYTIPLIIHAPGVAEGADLYDLNPDVRIDPGTGNIALSGVQPVRSHEAGNIALDLLGLPPIKGSVFNATHDLKLN